MGPVLFASSFGVFCLFGLLCCLFIVEASLVWFCFFNYLSLLQQRIQMVHTGTHTILFHSFTPLEQVGPTSPTNPIIADGDLSG